MKGGERAYRILPATVRIQLLEREKIVLAAVEHKLEQHSSLLCVSLDHRAHLQQVQNKRERIQQQCSSTRFEYAQIIKDKEARFAQNVGRTIPRRHQRVAALLAFALTQYCTLGFVENGLPRRARNRSKAAVWLHGSNLNLENLFGTLKTGCRFNISM